MRAQRRHSKVSSRTGRSEATWKSGDVAVRTLATSPAVEWCICRQSAVALACPHVRRRLDAANGTTLATLASACRIPICFARVPASTVARSTRSTGRRPLVLPLSSFDVHGQPLFGSAVCFAFCEHRRKLPMQQLWGATRDASWLPALGEPDRTDLHGLLGLCLTGCSC